MIFPQCKGLLAKGGL